MRSIIPGCSYLWLCDARISEQLKYFTSYPSPNVSAANADGRFERAIFHAGSLLPAGPSVFFDGKIMVRTGVYNGIPLLRDVTIEPTVSFSCRSAAAWCGPTSACGEGELAGPWVARAVVRFKGRRHVGQSQPGASQALRSGI